MTDPVPSIQPPPAPETGPPRLYRSRSDRMLGGVCGGIARRLDVDPIIIRIATVALVLSAGVGVLAYIIAWIVIPEAGPDEPERTARPASQQSMAVTVGVALIGLGAVLLLRQWMPWFGAGMFWPLVVVAAGAFLLMSGRR